MSGGIDSALTASLFKAAKYRVIGVTMPILQNPAETLRGEEACAALKIEHINVDLTALYEHTIKFYEDAELDFHNALTDGDAQRQQQIRQGNIRARLRMITLYNLASKNNGFVASTDNFSELAAGFWTLHGDVGDVAPIQSLTKSWEIPQLAKLMGVPKNTINATPTDGLGIANGDEDQFGFSYMEFDAVMLALIKNVRFSATSNDTKQLIAEVESRIGSTSFKRHNPYNLVHPIEGSSRYRDLGTFDLNVQRIKGE
jgi:NAD+ synthetase